MKTARMKACNKCVPFTLQYCMESQIRQRGYDPATSLICVKQRPVTTFIYIILLFMNIAYHAVASCRLPSSTCVSWNIR